jgi:hypothetical protein
MENEGDHFRQFCWHRIIVDESQVLKTSTAIKNLKLSMIESYHRWMLSGTPLQSSIVDIVGQLQCLQVPVFSEGADFLETCRHIKDNVLHKRQAGLIKTRTYLNSVRKVFQQMMIRHVQMQLFNGVMLDIGACVSVCVSVSMCE